MKAKDGINILNLRLLTENWVSRESLYGRVRNILFMLLIGGFCVPAIAGPTLDLTTVDSGMLVRLSANYREFMLDINQKGKAGGRMLSLDQIKIYLAYGQDLIGKPSSLDKPIYQFNTIKMDKWIKLNTKLNHGRGFGKMFAYIPNSMFVCGNYVHLYSMFGKRWFINGRFEECAFRKGKPLPVIPAPGAIVLGSIGLCFIGWLRRRETI